MQDYNQGALGVPAISAALGLREDNSTLITENWSQTISKKYVGPDPQGDFSIDATTIRGTTNSTVENDARNSNNLITASTRNVTILATQASQTSTTKTDERTITTTTNSSEIYFAYSTTALTSDNTTYRTTTGITSQTRSYRRTTTQTQALTIDATTTTGSHLNNVYAATVYQANTRHASNADVIWVANQSVASAIAEAAASDNATSTTRTTIWPVTKTTEFSIFDNTTTSSSSFTNSQSSQNLPFVRTNNVAAIETYVLYDFAIPQVTVTADGASTVTENTSVNNTIFLSNSFTAAKTRSATQTGVSITKISDTQLGLACDRTYYKTATRTIKANDTLWTTSGTTTSTAPAPSATWKTSSAGSDTLAIEGNKISQSTRREEGRTTLLIPPWQAKTTIAADSARIDIEAVSGVRTPDNKISGYYGAEGISCFADDAFVRASRNVQTAMPTSFAIFTNLGDLEELDLSEIGTATLSSLSGTATTTETDGTETVSSSFTFELTPEGNGTTFRGSGTNNVVSCGGTLGVSETAFVTIPAGIYKNLSGATVSKTEEVSSYTSGNGLKYSECVTFFETTATTSVSALVWTSPRNSTALP